MNVKITLTLFVSLIYATLNAQDCNSYYPFKEGVVFELSHYNKKGKTDGKGIYKVKSISNSGGAKTATMNMELFDEKGKPIISSEYIVTCKDDVISIDFSNLIPPAMYESYGEMEFEMSGVNLDMPNNLSVGQSLPDAHALMEVRLTPVKIKTSVDITNRKVETREKITTEAGTFDCFVVTYDTAVKSGMGITHKTSSKQWIAEKLGIIKQEDYNGNGKKTGHTELTAFEGISL